MTLAVDFLPQAESEIEAASLWYEEQSPGLGIRPRLPRDHTQAAPTRAWAYHI